MHVNNSEAAHVLVPTKFKIPQRCSSTPSSRYAMLLRRIGCLVAVPIVARYFRYTCTYPYKPRDPGLRGSRSRMSNSCQVEVGGGGQTGATEKAEAKGWVIASF